MILLALHQLEFALDGGLAGKRDAQAVRPRHELERHWRVGELNRLTVELYPRGLRRQAIGALEQQEQRR